MTITRLGIAAGALIAAVGIGWAIYRKLILDALSLEADA